jgi:hypothetical protein
MGRRGPRRHSSHTQGWRFGYRFSGGDAAAVSRLDHRLKGELIPPDDHLAIHCQPRHLLEVDEAGEPRGVNPGVFRVDDDGISTNWIEFQGDDFDAQFAEACLFLTSDRTVRVSPHILTAT